MLFIANSVGCKAALYVDVRIAAEADCCTFPQTGDIQSVAMKSKCLLRETSLVLQSAGFVAIFNGANYSNGMDSNAGC
jgi:hypothetical protein